MNLETIEYKYKNNRDVEIPALLDFVSSFPTLKSLLDVGAHDSHASYAPALAKLLEGKAAYHALDVLSDPITEKIVSEWFTRNYLDHPRFYDIIISISALEHSGITTYQHLSPFDNRAEIVQRIFEHANKLVYLTFPFGLPGGRDGQYENLTSRDLDLYDFLGTGEDFRVFERDFYYNLQPQLGHKWSRITRREAEQVPYDPNVDIQCLAICSWHKI